MAKGVSIKFRSYSETIPRLLELINLGKELKKHSKIVLKPFLREMEGEKSLSTPVAFVEEVLRFCLKHKNPVSEVFIAEGADGSDTIELFNQLGYTKLAEKYSVGMIDLNVTETERINAYDFARFSEIFYPKILRDSFVISLPFLAEDYETDIQGALSNMLGAFPGKHYKGFLTKSKTKIRKWPIKYSIHDILKCKMPEFAIIDSSEKGVILAGIPFEVDKQAAKLLNLDWRYISHLRAVEEGFLKELKENIEENEEKIANVAQTPQNQ